MDTRTPKTTPPDGTSVRKALLSIIADKWGFPDNGQLLYPSRSNWLRDSGADSGRLGSRVRPLHDDLGQRYGSRFRADDDLQRRRLCFRKPMHRRRKHGVECELGAAAPLNPVSGDLSNGQSLERITSSGFFNGVSCPSGSVCLAVGENPNETGGIAVPLNPDTARIRSRQEAHIISGIFMSGVACASSKRCLAVGHDSGGSGVTVALSPATGAILSGQRMQTIPGTGGVGLEGVACPMPSLCVAVGENSGRSAGVAVPLNPATGAIRRGQSAQDVTHKGILVALACPSTTVCLAVGWGAGQPSVAVPIDPRTGALSKGQSDRSISARAATLTAVSCPSISLCLAVGSDTGDPSIGQAVPIDPTTAAIVADQRIQTLAGTGALNAVVCHSATQCVAAGSRFASTGAVTEILDPATGRRS